MSIDLFLRFLRACYLAVAIVLVLSAAIGTASAQTPDLASPDRSGPLDPAEVESFIDAVMSEALAASYAPGAVVTVVQGDRLVMAKGYGVAHVETRDPIDPARTLFRIASITKLFTTAAALRLEEQGRLDLDVDVNRYLTRIRVPETFAEPVTARHLMTHRGGFDTAVSYMDFPDADSARQTPEQMSRDVVRVRPVSAIPIYDNIGFGVLGLVVADILESSYADAVRQEVFAPLGMERTVSGLPGDRVADAAQAHMRSDQWRARPIAHNIMPESAQGGGDISTTAEDMGRFLSALLVPGRLLQPATLDRMTDFDTWRVHPRLPGLGLGLWQYFYGGHPAEGHRGEINGFISRIALFREHKLGIFISVNSTVQAWPHPRLSHVLTQGAVPPPPAGAQTLDPDTLVEGLISRIAGRYLPAPPSRQEPGPLAAQEPKAEKLAGSYFRLDTTRHLMARILATLQAPQLKALPDGQFAIEGFCSPFVRTGALLYACEPQNGESMVIGLRVEPGERIFAGIGPVDAQERQPWWRTAPFAVWPVPFLVLLGLSALFVRRSELTPAGRRILGLAGVGSVLFLAALLLELQFSYDLSHSALHRLPLLWRLFFVVSASMLLASALLTLLGRGNFSGRQPGRTAYRVGLAFGSLGLVWFIGMWGFT